MTYINLPKNIDNLVKRLEVKATSDTYSAIATKFSNIEPVTWFNFPHQLNKIVDILKEYQFLLLDGNVQDDIDFLGKIYWFNYLSKVNRLISLVETIEAI